MKKLSNEAKVGIIAILTIVVFIWLYNFLKGNNVLNKDAVYYTVYDRVNGLAESSPVEVNGYRVGVVQSINFIDPTSGRLLVEFSVNRKFRIPKNSVAEIIPVSPLGGMKVRFVYGKGPGFYEINDTIPGKLSKTITEIVETELMPVKDKVVHMVTQVDTAITSINEVLNDNFRKDLNGTMSNLNNTTMTLSNVLGSREKELKESLASLERFTKMLSQNSDKMNNTFDNLESISDTLAAADIYNSITNLRSTLDETTRLLGNMNNGKGSAGKLVTDDSLYINLSRSLENLNLLLVDLKENPKRYVHFSVFGKKDNSAKE